MLARTLLSLSLALASTAGAAPAQRHAGAELRTAEVALSRGDYAKAYDEYLRHAGRDPLAQFTLGLFFQQGWGRPANTQEACRWFGRAARGGVPVAQHFTGDCLLDAARDKNPQARADAAAAALDWYMRAAAGGDIIAWCAAGELHLRGMGTPRDVARGLQLCAQAAQANSPPAMRTLAHWYQDDRDVPQDLAAARYWYGAAADHGDNEARYRLAVMLAQGEGGAPDADAALGLMERAAAAGYVPAYLPTATLYARMPPQADSGALSADDLAKVYMWSSAAYARLHDAAPRAQAQRLRDTALAVMPPTWRTDLDRRVAEHLATVPAQGLSSAPGRPLAP